MPITIQTEAEREIDPKKPFGNLHPAIRSLAVSRGIVGRVARLTGYSQPLVTRVFQGDRKTPRIIEELLRELRELTSEEAAKP